MHMIFDSAYNDRLTVLIGKDAANIFVQLRSEGEIAEEWPSLLGREDRMDKDLCQGLRHSEKHVAWLDGIQLFQS
jgi:hypothetical protein